MSDEAVLQPEDTVSRAEFNNLQEQLKATRVERDHEKFEKSEIVAKANAYAKERDELRARVNDAVAERDRLANEKAEASGKLGDAERRAQEAHRRADEALAETARLRHAIETAPSSDPVDVIWTLATQKAKAAHDWTRAKIPADSPALSWFDKGVALSLQVGCTAVKMADAFIRWATPKSIELFNRGKAELATRLEKK